MFAYNGQEQATRKGVYSVTQQEQHGFDTAAYAQTDPQEGGSKTGPGAESDTYDCLVCLKFSAAITTVWWW